MACSSASPDSNERHREKFQELHPEIVNAVNAASIIDYLFAKKVLSADDLSDLQAINERKRQCRRLLELLHTSGHPRAFLELRLALKNDDAYSWLEEKMSSLALAEDTDDGGRSSQLSADDQEEGEVSPARPVSNDQRAPQLCHTMPEGIAIEGVAVVDEELFLLRPNKARDEKVDQVEVYDIHSYHFKRHLTVTGLSAVADMTSCGRNRCLYISERIRNCVHRLQVNGEFTNWTVGEKVWGLSVTPNSNVLVTCRAVRIVKEYTTDGNLVQQLNLESDMVNLWHSVQLTTGQYVVCHGDSNAAMHRVCMVSADGRTTSTYGGQCGSAAGQMDVPTRLAVTSDQCIFVSDMNNQKVFLLSPSLKYECDVVSLGQGLHWWPGRLCIDHQRKRLYVSDNDWNPRTRKGRLLVFNL